MEAIRNEATVKVECPRELLERFAEALAAVEGVFEQREAAALTLGNELVRQWIEHDLNEMAQRFGDEVSVDGQRYRRHADGTRQYHTLCGPVEVRRASYRQVGIHNGPTVVPLDLRAGLRENATPALAFSVVQGFAERPLRHYQAEMAAAHRHVPSRSTLERMGKRIGDAIQAIVTEVEPAIRHTEPTLHAGRSISIGFDRTTVPMAELASTPTRRSRPYVRRAPPAVTVAYRMAYVGTVSLHDDEGTVLVTKRFAATPLQGPDDIVDRVANEVRHLRTRYGALPMTVVQDGAPELWNLVAQLCERHDLAPTCELIDRFHVDERLAEVCELVTYDERTARELRESWRKYLDRSDTAMSRIVRRIDELLLHVLLGALDGDPPPRFWEPIARHRLSAESQQIISRHVEYFRNHRHLMRYASSLRCGYPIGSGPTEGACKSVVTMRFKRSGQRWLESGLAPCLSLRALHLSERLRPCFARLQASRFATLAAA